MPCLSESSFVSFSKDISTIDLWTSLVKIGKSFGEQESVGQIWQSFLDNSKLFVPVMFFLHFFLFNETQIEQILTKDLEIKCTFESKVYANRKTYWVQ